MFLRVRGFQERLCGAGHSNTNQSRQKVKRSEKTKGEEITRKEKERKN